MSYQVSILPAARRELKRLQKSVRVRIIARIDALADDPRPPQSTQLKGTDEYRRIRTGSYRIIYKVKDEQLIVLVLKVGHRKQVYRNLD